eukprot:4520966-Amphidinium_carterae.1
MANGCSFVCRFRCFVFPDFGNHNIGGLAREESGQQLGVALSRGLGTAHSSVTAINGPMFLHHCVEDLC